MTSVIHGCFQRNRCDRYRVWSTSGPRSKTFRDLSILFQVCCGLLRLRLRPAPGIPSLDPSISLRVEPDRGRRVTGAQGLELFRKLRAGLSKGYELS